jgi:flagellar FliJ protein
MSLNLKSLATVIDLARRRRDEVGAQLAYAQQALRSAHAQMDQLTHFADEGQSKWMARSATGVSPVLMQHQRDFSLKIQHAIDFQTNVIAQKESLAQAAIAALQLAERELATLEKVAERTLAQRRQAAHKAEQKINDEMAMSMLAHQRRQAEQESAP